MKIYLDCIPCFFDQAIRAVRLAKVEEEKGKEVLERLCKEVPNFFSKSSPPEIGRIVYKIVREVTGKEDPLKELKEKSNQIALSFYPELKKEVNLAEDKLLTAIKLAIAGNIIDFAKESYSNFGKKDIENVLKKDFAIFDYQKFKEVLKNAKQILYLADNAGETVFDRILIEELIKLDKEVIYVVKDKPVINDALKEDAEFCGIDKIAKVISNGSDIPGTILKYCSPEFLEFFKKADLIISKGQGNFESLSDEKGPIFFLFRVKCPVVANHTKCKVGDLIFKSNI